MNITFKNKRVLITGGASGIGKIMGSMALERGAELVIWDVNTQAMQATAQEFASLGKISVYTVDVTSYEQITLAAKRVKQELGPVDILINNAGIVVGKYFQDHTRADIDRTMQINTLALMYITQQFLPDMLERNTGSICNIASSAGLISNPRMSVYAASKWAVIGWSDSLRLEMEQQHKNIHVTTIAPYYINTGMFDGVRSIVPILKPENVARSVIRGIEEKRVFISMPWNLHFVRFGQAVMSVRLFDWFVGGVMGIYKTMDHFTGRK